MLKNIFVKIPILRSLNVCTRASRTQAFHELKWNVGFAFFQVLIVALIVIFAQSFKEMPAQIWSVISGGELMIYAASVCGAVLYSLRHNFDGPMPDSLKYQATSLGTLTVTTGICLFLAVLVYIIKRMGILYSFPVNTDMINIVSVLTLIYAICVAYVVFSLKHSLASGAALASREQSDDFSKKWGNRDA